MSLFEIVMLVCFGAAWPFSIWKSWRTRQVAGKSLPFLLVILFGYLSGIVHKLLFRFDLVIYLYVLNAAMVALDIALYLRNRLSHVRESLAEARGLDHARREGRGGVPEARSRGATVARPRGGTAARPRERTGR